MAPVETSLYEYVDDGRGEERYRITATPPLRFAFPAAYYTRRFNAEGGPQSMLELAIDPTTFKPTRLVSPAYDPNRKAEIHAERLEKEMIVTISSNLMGGSSPALPNETYQIESLLRSWGQSSTIGLKKATK